MTKEPFVTHGKLKEIVKEFPTPFHLYDEKGIRRNAKAVKEAFAWNPGFREYFAVKATPNPFLMQILKEYGCGLDCSSMTELMMADALGFSGEGVMFSSNDTPAEEFAYADQIGATINLDDFTHIEFLEKTIGRSAMGLWTTQATRNMALPKSSCLKGFARSRRRGPKGSASMRFWRATQ